VKTFNASRCSRCLSELTGEELLLYLVNDHLCSKEGCLGVEDSEYMAKIKESEKQSRVRVEH
jgi:hypothetical protein